MTDQTPSQEVTTTGEGEAASPQVLARRTGMFGTASGDTSGYGGMVTTVYAAPAATRPFGSYFDEIADVLAEVLTERGFVFDEVIERVVIDRGQLTLVVNRDYLVEVCRILRDDQDTRFEMCLSVSGVHYPEDTGREFHVVHHLLSVTHNRRVRLEVVAPDSDPRIPSVVSLYPSADWHERETYDMFGVIFEGHPALTRILMPDDWPGHPQRKDYPLGGIPVEYKGASIPPPDTRRSYR